LKIATAFYVNKKSIVKAPAAENDTVSGLGELRTNNDREPTTTNEWRIIL